MRGMILCGLFVAALASCRPPANEGLLGVWRMTEVVFSTPNMSRIIANPQPGAFIFTKRHYSFMHIWGDEPRSFLPDSPNDAERLESLERLRTSLGTYEASDSTITIKRWIASYENLMGHTQTSPYRIVGDTLWVGWVTEDGVAEFKFIRIE